MQPKRFGCGRGAAVRQGLGPRARSTGAAEIHVKVGQSEDLAALSPYQTRHIKRFGDYVFTVTAPEPFDADLITPFPLESTSEEQSATA